ncbi:SPOR domain-containing protein [Domibacillus epiphyticus]|uniref:SPOR domain-containing protein n=1 Tax=Domibacillus epiphyticus TaxID=1714355 RepID=A0A1V2A9M6_9BACI|nr:SPOR domain-containing protein [Domibacillus epiphyticus]OMP67542.1 hypothetical protein BTO28_06245 [Domibacillus epiphyticus]
MDEPDWSYERSDVLIWQLPGEEAELESETEPIVIQKKKSIIRPAAGAVIVMSALITGTLFGVTMIRAVNVPDEKPAAAAVSKTPVQEVKRGKVKLSVIQGGLFSTEETAKKGLKTAKAKKMPASIIKHGEQYMLLFGAYLSKSEADQAAQLIEEKGTAVYVKEVSASMTESAEKTFSAEADHQKRLDQLKEALSP